MMTGYLGQDGRKGIRNLVLVVYLVECAHHVAAEIVRQGNLNHVHLIGFSGCAPNKYAANMMKMLCTHPNVGGILLVSLGCENLRSEELESLIRESGRPVRSIIIQKVGGTAHAVNLGKWYLNQVVTEAEKNVTKTDLSFSDLVIGTICGGSDATSGITANPAVGLVFDELRDEGATCIFEEPGELIGCEYLLADRARDESLAFRLLETIRKAARYYEKMGHDSFSEGNGAGGLTTIEEKSLGSYCKSGSSRIDGIIYPGELPPVPGLYLMDVVPDGEVKWGFPNLNDNAEIIEMIASGAHLILFTTGRGSVVGSAISPVIKICANPQTYEMLSDDMDINAGKIILGQADIFDISWKIIEAIKDICTGVPSKSEKLGHREFVLGYKSFDEAFLCVEVGNMRT